MNKLIIVVVCFLALFHTQLVSADLTEGLVASFQFEGNANDSTVNSHHGIEYGNIEYVARNNRQSISCENGGVSSLTSYFNKDFAFNRPEGTSYFHEISNQSNPQAISVWFKTTDNNITDWGGLIVGISSNSSRTYIQVNNNYLSIVYGGDSDFVTKELPSVIVNDGLWHHVVMISYGDAGKKEVYFDGDLKLTFSGGINGNTIGGFYRICGYTLYQGEYRNNFQGEVDNLKVYNKALSETEVQELFNLGEEPCKDPSSESVSPNLDIHLPSVNYQSLTDTLHLWVELEFYGKDDNNLLWKLKDYGANTIDCVTNESTIVLPNLDIQLPSIDYQLLSGTINLWANFEYHGQSNKGELLWKLKDYGENKELN